MQNDITFKKYFSVKLIVNYWFFNLNNFLDLPYTNKEIML